MNDNDVEKETAVVPASAPQQQAPTLLPSTLARAVSFATRSSSLALRLGTTVGSYSLNTARFTTLSSLELARGVLEGVLVRAGRDVSLLSQSSYAAADAETVLEKSLESLHHAVSQIVFWTSAGFQVTGTAMGTASDVGALLLSALDQILGSTDSSRAIASIITLVRREFSNPVTGTGERVGVMDLMVALSALAYLQQQCRRSIEEERREYEEVIWDVVVLTDGERVDVHDNSLTGSHPGYYSHLNSDSAGQRDDAASIRSVPTRRTPWHSVDGDEDVVSRLKEQMSASLPPGATVSISNSVSTTQTITVDVHGQKPSSIPSLPGAEVVETRPASAQGHHPESDSYRIVYKIQRDKLRNNVLRIQEDSDVTLVDPCDDKELPAPPAFEDDSTAIPSPPALPTSQVDAEATASKESVTDKSRKAPPAGMRPIDIPKRGTRGSGPNSPRSPISPEESLTGQSPPGPEATANQKKQRAPLSKSTARTSIARPKEGAGKRPTVKKAASEPKPTEKKASFKQVLKGGGQSLSSMLNKDAGSPNEARDRPRPQWKTPGASGSAATLKPTSGKSKLAQHVARHPDPASIPRSSSRASYVSISERRRDSMVSQADAWAIDFAGEMRPTTPTIVRTEVLSHDTAGPSYPEPSPGLAPPHRGGHRRLNSHAPSMYSLATNDSQQSLVLSSCYQKSAYSASDAMSTLRKAGAVEGTFPSRHLLQNISRYMRFSSACYGSSFLKVMGISTDMPSLRVDDETHNDVRHFVHHTESGAGNVLLASFVDQGGGSNAAGSTDSGVPLVHYVSLDHDAKAVVLACRGTLGFEDVLADMTCEYDDLVWRGRAYKVHKGVHASAQRILYGGDGKVLITLQEALREFPGYGLILCGHSLGGAVASLLGVMLSEPNPYGTGFVTASGKHAIGKHPNLQVPSGRRIHVFAYGPPGVMASSLNKLTRGLITTVVHGNDLVPHLSLGLLHDFQALALAFNSSSHPTKSRLRSVLLSALQSSLPLSYLSSPSSIDDDQETWMLPALQSLRESMQSQKLMPPGEVFCIESTRVLRRDAFLVEGEAIGRPARRVVLKYVRDVKRRFGEVRFAGSMLVDHSPKGYEEALRRLRLGIVE